MIDQLLISGIPVRSIRALLGLALVLIHKATDVANFAQREMSVFSTFLAPARIDAAERLLRGTRAADARIREAAGLTVHGSLPLTDNGHKAHLLVNLTERALQRALAGP